MTAQVPDLTPADVPPAAAVELVTAALAVRSPADFAALRDQLSLAGVSEERPLGDLPQNVSIISASGDPEYLLVELVTNGFDAVLEQAAAGRRARGEDSFDTPTDLAGTLWQPGVNDGDIAKLVTMTTANSSDPTRPTIIVRDLGIGVAAERATSTILSLAHGPKDDKPYLVGAFGKGGSTMHRESRGCVLVSRPSAELIDETGSADRVWLTVIYAKDRGKARTWVYRVATAYDRNYPADTGKVASFAPPVAPDGSDLFEPGTYIAHVAYNAPQVAKHSTSKQDRRSMWVLGNTRLYRPPMLWIWEHEPTGNRERMHGRARNFEHGTPEQLASSPIVDRVPVQDPETGAVHHLEIKAFLFAKPQRRNATADGHVVAFTVNGQVQAHWDAPETRKRTSDAEDTLTGLRRVAESALFCEVRCDTIPALVRSELIAPDRTGLTDNGLARAVQATVASWLVAQPAIIDLEKELAADSTRSRSDHVVSSALLDEIARRLGFTGTGATSDPGDPPAPEPLFDEPTELSGPQKVTVVAGQARLVRFSLNATNDFVPNKATATLTIDTPGFVAATPSSLKRGRFTMSAFADDSVPEGTYAATCRVEWLSKAGSHKHLEWDLKIQFVHEAPERSEPKDAKGPRPVVIYGPGDGPDSAGSLEDHFTGNELADTYEHLEHARSAGDRRVVALFVNEDFKPWKKYLKAVAANHGDAEVAKRKNRYLVAAACAIAQFYGGAKSSTAFDGLDDAALAAACAVAAETAIATLPEESE